MIRVSKTSIMVTLEATIREFYYIVSLVVHHLRVETFQGGAVAISFIGMFIQHYNF